MKALARSFVWWSGLDTQIEELGRGCYGAQANASSPPKAPLHPWEWPAKPWQCLHIDFAGPFHGLMWLIVVDAHSKWPEVPLLMSTVTAATTITKLRSLFALHGLPEQVVSDNGTQFTSHEFQRFIAANGIRHIRSAPYHPATNGLVERFVQTFKRAMKSNLDATLNASASHSHQPAWIYNMDWLRSNLLPLYQAAALIRIK